jgi:ABC-type bacteriocin/lantibiotic exporter with double-glycine peptidase domain
MSTKVKLALISVAAGLILAALGTAGLLRSQSSPRWGADPDQVNSAAPYPKSSAQPVREALLCGPNSVYMLLALCDIAVDHRVIDQWRPSHSEGMSLSEIQQMSMENGLPADIRQCSLDELKDSVQFPVIAHLNLKTGTHYDVILGVDDTRVHVLDGTTGAMQAWPHEWLRGCWTGYVLIPRPPSSIRSLAAVVCIAIIVLALSYTWSWQRLRNMLFPRSAVRTPR